MSHRFFMERIAVQLAHYNLDCVAEPIASGIPRFVDPVESGDILLSLVAKACGSGRKQHAAADHLC